MLVDDRIENRALKIRETRLQAKTEQGVKAIHSALKLARGFERQKLGRRQKTAKNDNHELLRLKEEVICLKALDLVETAKHYLFKQLVRTKRIRESSAFVSLYGSNPEIRSAKAGAEANVTGRLFNSKPVKEALPEIMKGICGCLGLEGATESSDKLYIGRESSKADDRAASQGLPLRSESSGLEESNVLSEDIAPSHDRTSNINGAKGIIADYDTLLPSPSNSVFGDNDELLESPRINAAAGDPSLSPTASISSPPPLPKKIRSEIVAIKPLSNTTFLPSLMMGGYFSESDSDAEQDAYHGSTVGALQPRKNRRGQRARQQIAEKKFGRRANHLKDKPGAEIRGRDSGWDARKGATEVGDGRERVKHVTGGRGHFKGKNGRTTGPTGANDVAVQGRRPLKTHANDGQLHPSWEAAKKRKEQSQSMFTTSTGRKTVFD